jgi:hypothetical protein
LAKDDARIRANEERFAREEAARAKAPGRLPRMQGKEGFEVRRWVR